MTCKHKDPKTNSTMPTSRPTGGKTKRRRLAAGSALLAGAALVAAVGLIMPQSADAGGGHSEETKAGQMEMMKGKSGEGMMGEGMIQMPIMNAARGRKLYAEKGCVVCHAVNGIGGEDAPPLDATQMTPMMNPFEFAAKMWRGAEAMVILQQEELGETIELSGDELADIIAFAHSHAEQEKFSEDDIPERIEKLIAHDDSEDDDDHKD